MEAIYKPMGFVWNTTNTCSGLHRISPKDILYNLIIEEAKKIIFKKGDVICNSAISGFRDFIGIIEKIDSSEKLAYIKYYYFDNPKKLYSNCVSTIYIKLWENDEYV